MEHKKAKWSGGASGLNEKTLSLLFDYQRFEHEPELEALLDEALDVIERVVKANTVRSCRTMISRR